MTRDYIVFIRFHCKRSSDSELLDFLERERKFLPAFLANAAGNDKGWAQRMDKKKTKNRLHFRGRRVIFR